MSDIVEKTEIEEVVKDVLEIIVEDVEEEEEKEEEEEEKEEEKEKEKIEEVERGVLNPVVKEEGGVLNPVVIEITKLTFSQLVESFLNENKLDTLSMTVSPEIQNFLLLLCKEQSCFFSDVEISLNKIILDNKIDTKDIPEIILLVAKVYEIITTDTKVSTKFDPYELIKTILNIVFTLYIETNKVQNKQLATELLKIIDVSIDLIKLKSINLPKIGPKIGCLHSIFKCFIE